jgi:hypothetical protein
MTQRDLGYSDGQAAALDNPRAFGIPPRGPVEWQAGWRAGFRAEQAFRQATTTA